MKAALLLQLLIKINLIILNRIIKRMKTLEVEYKKRLNTKTKK